MQSSASSYFFLFFPIFFISLWALISFLISYVGGWHSLAQQFRNDGPVYGERYRWQAAGMRWTARYNGCLTISADIHGLNLSTNILFRIAHPPLFIPWSEITLTRKRVFFSPWSNFASPVNNASLSPSTNPSPTKLKPAAGSSWPTET